MNATNTVITTQDLTLGYKNTIIASGMTFSIQQGEFIGIFGANGSGKTTFIKSLLGLIKPLSGSISIFDHTPEYGNQDIGYMPQLRGLHPIMRFTGRTIMTASIKSTQLGLPMISTAQKNEVEKMLHWVEADSYADRPFYQLSGGERQRIYLAQSLLGYPKVLLLDEPLSGLDPHYQEKFIQLLVNIQSKLNSTILFTAHDPNPLLAVMSRVLYFANKKVALGTVDEVITSEKLSTLYETPIDVIHYKNRLIVIGELMEGHHD